MKEYKVKIGEIEIAIMQDDDGKFIKPDIVKSYEQIGSSLKPAREPIILARKPIEKGLSIAENCLKWGTGGLNISSTKIGRKWINNGMRKKIEQQLKEQYGIKRDILWK